MNIFVLDTDIEKCAQYHFDKHVYKMILESAQMLSTTIRLTGIDAGYKESYVNHPCTKWTRESLSNWRWLRDLAIALNKEWVFRYNHPKDKKHKSLEVIYTLPEPNIPDIGLTPFAQAMPDEYKSDDAVESYRSYYVWEKAHLAAWKNRQPPYWWFDT